MLPPDDAAISPVALSLLEDLSDLTISPNIEEFSVMFPGKQIGIDEPVERSRKMSSVNSESSFDNDEVLIYTKMD